MAAQPMPASQLSLTPSYWATCSVAAVIGLFR